MQVLLQHAKPVLNGHVVARERHHAGAMRDVQIVKRSALEIVRVSGRGLAHNGGSIALRRNRCTGTSPLCHET